jgi:hypothetical protein
VEEQIKIRWSQYIQLYKRIIKALNLPAQIHKNLNNLKERNNLILTACFVALTRMITELVVEFQDNNKAWRKLNEKDQAYGISGNELIEMLNIPEKIVFNSPINPQLQAVSNQLMAQNQELELNWWYEHLINDLDYLSNNPLEIWQTKYLKASTRIKNAFTFPFYKLQSIIYTWVGDTKAYVTKPFMNKQCIKGVIHHLKPGDVIILRKHAYLSNAFLPGFWSHAILYTGNAEQLINQGFSLPNLNQKLIHSNEPLHTPCLVEAISEGVVFSSPMDALQADCLTVLRPNLNQDKINQAIRRALYMLGAEYDFDFDMESADKLFCTELIYRIYGSHINFKTTQYMGHRRISAGSIIHNTFSDDSKKMEFILFMDSAPNSHNMVYKMKNDLLPTLDYELSL